MYANQKASRIETPRDTIDRREVGEIGQQAQHLKSTISNLSCQIDHLNVRLAPILHTPAPVNPEGLGMEPRDTEMGQFLHAACARIDALIAQLEDITGRVAL